MLVPLGLYDNQQVTTDDSKYRHKLIHFIINYLLQIICEIVYIQSKRQKEWARKKSKNKEKRFRGNKITTNHEHAFIVFFIVERAHFLCVLINFLLNDIIVCIRLS